ncbi:MAG: MFS transporter [Clostridia bacterium]|nr:MFS transporter [Clostridia bacterium]
MKKLSFNHTKTACYIGSVCQSIVCVFLPLLFVTFNQDYGIPLALVTLFASVNFIIQLTMDFTALFYIDRVSYRKTIVIAHLLTACGFLFLGTVAPKVDNIYPAILFSVVLFSAGGGLFEVLLSPIIEGCPSDNKAATMSMLHSMYGFGSIGVILLTNILLFVLGEERWHYIAIVWAFVPFFNAIYFMFVPINRIVENSERMPLKQLIKRKSFLIFVLIMFCAGATEIGMSQWASAFAESSLGVSKTVGDMLGPCLFASMMALSRVMYSKLADRINLAKYLMACGILTVGCFLVAALSPFKLASLLACGFCGFAVGIMWPGAVSLTSNAYPMGGAAMFGVLALAGDIGCTTGPTVVGFMASAFGGELKTGLLISCIFPVLLVVSTILLLRRVKKHPEINI